MSKWFFNYRQQWILEHIENTNQITCQLIMDKFDIGKAQATRDITEFRKNNPNLLQYDTGYKKWVTNDFYGMMAWYDCNERAKRLTVG